MEYDFDYQSEGQWIKVGNLFIDLNSLEKGFLETQRHRQEIWDYIKYRESLVAWPLIQRQI